MNDRLERYRQAGFKAVEFQLERQQPDGCYIWDDAIRDAYHKQSYSWCAAGFYGPTHKLLTWVRDNTLQPEGGLKDYNGDVYKQSWFFQGAHRMKRFDLSYPIMDFLLSCRAPCGGFPHFGKDEYVRALSTCWMAVSALCFGRPDVAVGAADCCVSMLEQQPDEGRFYCQMTRDGRLVTQEVDARATFIDFGKPKQPYWEIGLPWLLMGRLFQITRDPKYLELATRFFELKLRCFEDRFTHTGSGKSALAAAVHYLNTGDVCARDAVYTFLDFLLDTQAPDGSWPGPPESDSLLIRIDAAAEFNVWIQETVGILAATE